MTDADREAGAPTAPPSVEAYLTDPAMRTGVEALLLVGPDDLPPGLQAREYADYLAARSAAEMTKYDLAAFKHRLWEAVWGRHLVADWRLAPFAELVAEEYAVTPERCWDESAFAVYHRRNGYCLYTGLGFDKDETTIACALGREDGDEIEIGADPSVWSADSDWEGWISTRQSSNPVGANFELSRLVTAAREVLSKIDQVIAG